VTAVRALQPCPPLQAPTTALAGSSAQTPPGLRHCLRCSLAIADSAAAAVGVASALAVAAAARVPAAERTRPEPCSERLHTALWLDHSNPDAPVRPECTAPARKGWQQTQCQRRTVDAAAAPLPLRPAAPPAPPLVGTGTLPVCLWQSVAPRRWAVQLAVLAAAVASAV
jgi:hypothetical protein